MARPLLTGIVLGTLVLSSGLMATSAPNQTSRNNPTLTKSLSSPNFRIAQAESSITSLEQAVYTQVNQYRADRGLPSLTLDSRISDQARTHSQDMASGKVPFGHDGFTQRVQAIAQVIRYSAAAENVAYNQGYKDPVSVAVQGWLQSTGHRANIEGQYNLTGVGIAKDDRGGYYFTQLFIRSR